MPQQATIPAPKESAKDSPKDSSRGRIFKTTQHLGRYIGTPEHPFIFSEEDFVNRHPISMRNDKAPSDIDPDTYHDALIEHHLALGNIVEAPGETPTIMPDSVGAGKNLGISGATREILEERRKLAQSRASDIKTLETNKGG